MSTPAKKLRPVEDKSPLEINFDPEQLTIGQIEQLEEATGQPLSELIKQIQSQAYTAKMLKAIVWILVAANDPEFTLEDAANVKLAAVMGAAASPPDVDAPAAANGASA